MDSLPSSMVTLHLVVLALRLQTVDSLIVVTLHLWGLALRLQTVDSLLVVTLRLLGLVLGLQTVDSPLVSVVTLRLMGVTPAGTCASQIWSICRRELDAENAPEDAKTL